MDQMSQMRQAELKRRLQQQYGMDGNPNPVRQRASMATFSQEEFHPEVMNVGSTGEYQDMTGGAHFTHYDCGDPYDDSIIRETFQKKPKEDKGKEMLAFLRSKSEAQKALIAGEILGTRGGMKRNRRK